MYKIVIMELLEKSITELEFNKVKNVLSNFAKLQQSQQLCLNLEIKSDIEEIKQSLKYTSEAKRVLDNGHDIPIEHIPDTNEYSKDKLNSYLSETELIEISKAFKTARLIKNYLKENSANTSLCALAETLFVNKELEDTILSKFDEDGIIKQDATEHLNKLFNSLKAQESELKTKVSELLGNPQFTNHLQEKIYTIRDNRVVFPVMASAKSKVAGITHDFSATNKTVFIEPSVLIPLNNKIRELKSKINEEIVKILKELTKLVKSHIEELAQNEKVLTELDFHFAKARYAVKIKAVEQAVSDTPQIKITKMIHPLLIGNSTTIVANDFEIGTDYKGVIITGSNTGGKTVTLKTVGLMVLMTKAGLFLPCDDAIIYPFEKVFADIGDSQNIMQNLSTFSGHLKKIIEMINNGDEKTLCLIDEICAGTDPQEGAILSEVILDEMSTKGITCVVTTHFGELKTLEYANNYFKNASVEFDRETLKPTYKLMIGIPGTSNTLLIAENLGIASNVISRAKDILGIKRNPSAIIIERLSETQQKLDKNLKDVETMKNESEKLKDEYEVKIEEIRRDKKKTIKNIESKFYSELTLVKREMKDILEEIKANKDEKTIRRSYTKLSQLEQGFKHQVSDADINDNYDDIDFNNVKIGDTLMIKDINQPVTLVSMPDKGNNVEVQMGLIKTKIKTTRLTKLDKTLAKKPKLRLQSINSFEYNYKGISNTIDLRGYRVQDALEMLEEFLDKASLNNLSPIYIIHGHGTGALKSWVRDYVDSSPYISKYRVGEPAEGGDGVTVVDLA